MTNKPRTTRQALNELHTALTDLTQPVRRKVLRDGGQTTTHTAPSLLDQLRAATGTSGEAGGGGRGSRNPIPIDPDAVELLGRIRTEVVDLYDRALEHSRWGIEDHLRTVITMIDRWDTVADIDWATGWLRYWRHVIAEQLDPGQRHFLDAACPECGARMTTKTVDGELVQVHALLVDSRNGADCQACRAHWPPERLDFLARLIAMARPPVPTSTS